MRPANKRGLSLLEVILAIAILGGALVTIGQLIRIGARSAAEEPERKERMSRYLRKLSLIADIRRAVERSRSGRAPRNRFLERLRESFSEAEAERQLSTALDWARYGEVFDFDPDAEEFVLPPS